MLIVLRGNSGSGKTTTAYLLRDEMQRRQSDAKVAVIEQDYLRRVLLKERESAGGDNIGLIEQTVRYSLDHGYIVILEGMLVVERYGMMLRRLVSAADESRVFYFDVSLPETLRRHAGKPNARDFGEKELRQWYREHDVLGTDGEIVLGEELSQSQTIGRILSETGLL